MDNGSCSGGGTFKIEHRPDAVEVAKVNETEAREVGDMFREGKVWIKSNTEIADKRFRCEGKK